MKSSGKIVRIFPNNKVININSGHLDILKVMEKESYTQLLNSI